MFPLSLLSVFSYHLDRKISCLDTFLIETKGLPKEEECNQDFVAPALCHIPIEVVCVSQWESTSIERECLLVLCFEQYQSKWARVTQWRNFRWRPKPDHRAQWNQGRDDQAKYPRITVNNDNWVLNQFNSLVKDDYFVQSSKSEKKIVILWRNCSFFERCIHSDQKPECWQRNGEDWGAVHHTSKRFDKTGQL